MSECKHCGKDIEIRNPSGFCDHLYYPESCDICCGDKPSLESQLKAAQEKLVLAEKVIGLTQIEIQSIVDAMYYTQENTVTSDAHVLALKKLKAYRQQGEKP